MSHIDQPNILIIVTDQQSHDLLSCAGTGWVSTPNLDRLAASGTRFSRAYCSNPVCVPSRFSMFTGRMPSAIRLRGNEGPGVIPFTASHDRTGMGHQMRAAGYETWYGGKVHWPIDLTPERLGFTTYSEDERERLAIDAGALIRSRTSRPWAAVASFINPHDICYHAIREFAADTADRQLIERGTVELSCLDEALRPPAGVARADFLRDHLPPLPANAAIQDDEPELIGTSLAKRAFKVSARERWSDQDWRLHRWAYARLMERADRQIGTVLDALDASGQAENTLVVMTSDHGDHAGSHRLEHKTFFYDEAARVPWLMRLPGRIPAGAVVDGALVATGLDLMATCCDYAGAPLPPHCLGISQRATAEGRPGASGRNAVYSENAVGNMLVTRHWKYVRYDSGRSAEQLYDLDHDPGETRNHADEAGNAGILADLRLGLDREIAHHAALALDDGSAQQAVRCPSASSRPCRG